MSMTDNINLNMITSDDKAIIDLRNPIDSPDVLSKASNDEKMTNIEFSQRGSTLSYHQLKYTVNVTGGCCRNATKQILHGLDGIFYTGMNAIMGPTGGGKTTLLDVLAGRAHQEYLDGRILVDGKRPPRSFKRLAGYVVQDDIVMGTLTVRENLMFSANLRLSKKDNSHECKLRKVEETIQELGLSACADTKVGTELIRGVSGGERRRTNIGMELIITPSFLFLDEPTTGLDASTANAVMSLLHRLSRRGRTIIFSIHQPRYGIFKLFDRLTLLAAGRTAYHGPAADALAYFEKIGYICEEHNNPSDFFLDVINGDSTAVKTLDHNGYRAGHETNGGDLEISVIVNSQHERTLAEQLASTYLASEEYKRLSVQLNSVSSRETREDECGRELEAPTNDYATSFATQFRHVSGRALLNLIRNPAATIVQTTTSIFIAVVIGIVFLRLGFDYPSGIQNRYGALFFIIQMKVFSNLSGVELFIKERALFIHENASGFYRSSSYFFAKIFCDFIPIRLIPQIAMALITYFMIGLQLAPGNFFIFFLTTFLVTMDGCAIMFAVSASFSVFTIANLLNIIVFILMMVFGGLLVNIASLPVWLRWLQYLSIFRYALNALSINELYGLSFTDAVHVNNSSEPRIITGAEYLTSQGIGFGSAWDLWQNILALILIAVGIMFLAYVQLRRIKKLK